MKTKKKAGGASQFSASKSDSYLLPIAKLAYYRCFPQCLDFGIAVFQNAWMTASLRKIRERLDRLEAKHGR